MLRSLIPLKFLKPALTLIGIFLSVTSSAQSDLAGRYIGVSELEGRHPMLEVHCESACTFEITRVVPRHPNKLVGTLIPAEAVLKLARKTIDQTFAVPTDARSKRGLANFEEKPDLAQCWDATPTIVGNEHWFACKGQSENVLYFFGTNGGSSERCWELCAGEKYKLAE